MSVEEYFLKYNNEKVFVILLGSNSSKSYFYYPKGDALFIVNDHIELKEIDQIIGSSLAGMKLSNPTESWDKIKSREVKWYISGKEIISDNIYVILESEDQFKLIENASPNRLKYYILHDQNPFDYKDWCCVLIASTKNIEVPNTFKKISIKEILSNS